MIIRPEEEKIVLEIRELVNGVEKAKDDFNVYCDLMKQLFLSKSGTN